MKRNQSQTKSKKLGCRDLRAYIEVVNPDSTPPDIPLTGAILPTPEMTLSTFEKIKLMEDVNGPYKVNLHVDGHITGSIRISEKTLVEISGSKMPTLTGLQTAST